MECYEQGRRMSTMMGDRRGECDVLGWLGMLLSDMGRVDEATATHRASLVVSSEIGYWQHAGTYLAKLGRILDEKGDTKEADAAFTEGEAIVRRVGNPACIGILLADRAVAAARRGDPAAARFLLAETEGCAAMFDAAATSEIGVALTRARAMIEGTAR